MQLQGMVVSPGVAFGQAIIIQTQPLLLDYRPIPTSQVPLEIEKLHSAVIGLIAHLRQSQTGLDETSENYQLIDADILILEDEDLVEELTKHIGKFQVNAQVAVDLIFQAQADEVAVIDDPYLANRSDDILCLAKRLINQLQGHKPYTLASLTEPCIVVANDLTPADFALFAKTQVKGVVIESGGLTSHTAILARSAGIPAMVSCSWSHHKKTIERSSYVVLDAIEGALHIDPDKETLQQLNQRYEHHRHQIEALQIYKDKPSVTQDNHSVSLKANVGNLNEVSSAMQYGANGIGLFRTEFLLIGAKTIPSEDVQYKLYCDALQLLKGQVLTIRTFDIGSDKLMPCIHQQQEDNPALGIRGIRLSLLSPQIIIPQLRAILKAANHGPIRLMFPMISQLEELEKVLLLLEQAKTQLTDEGQGFGHLEIGIVVETPGAALCLNNLLPYLDFVSIGSNDLTQYTLAADRTNAQLAKDYPPLSPAVIKLIDMVISQCKAAKVTVCLCGELAGDSRLLPLLIGMGFDELSINPSELLAVKAKLINGHFDSFLALYQRVAKAKTCCQIQQYIDDFHLNHG